MLKLLAIDTGTEPITVEKVTLPTDDRDALKANILNLLNKHGKNSHVLIGWKGDLWLCSHTAKRGPSNAYFKQKVKYHPMSDEVLN